MAEKVCPACGKENSEERKFCAKCFTSLEGAVAAPSQPMSQVGVPPGPVQDAAPRREYKPPANHLPDPDPVQRPPSSVPWGMVFVLVLLIAGGLAFQFIKPKPVVGPKVSAETVVNAFLQAKQTGKLDNVKPYLSEVSLKKLDKAFSGKQAESAGITRGDVQDMFLFGVEPTPRSLKENNIQVVRKDDRKKGRTTAVVRAGLSPKVKGFADVGGPDYWFVCVIEGDKWKVDLDKSLKEQKVQNARNFGIQTR